MQTCIASHQPSSSTSTNQWFSYFLPLQRTRRNSRCVNLVNSHKIVLKVHQYTAIFGLLGKVAWMYRIQGCAAVPEPQILAARWELLYYLSAMVTAKGLPACCIGSFPSRCCNNKHEGQWNNKRWQRVAGDKATQPAALQILTPKSLLPRDWMVQVRGDRIQLLFSLPLKLYLKVCNQFFKKPAPFLFSRGPLAIFENTLI